MGFCQLSSFIVLITKEDLKRMHRWLNISYENADKTENKTFNKEDAFTKINHFRETLSELEVNI